MDIVSEVSSDLTIKPYLSESESAIKFINDIINLENDSDWKTSIELYALLFKFGKEFSNSMRRKCVIYVILKVLRMIREKCAEVLTGKPELEEYETNALFVAASHTHEFDLPLVEREDLTELIQAGLLSIRDEISFSDKQLANGVSRCVREGEVVALLSTKESLPCIKNGLSRINVLTLLVFLQQQQSSKVIEALCPNQHTTLLVPAVASTSMWPRCQRLLLHATGPLLSDGSVRCPPGSLRLVLQAAAFCVPVHVVCASYRLLPEEAHHDDCCNDDVIPASAGVHLVMNNGCYRPHDVFALSRAAFYPVDVRDFLRQ